VLLRRVVLVLCALFLAGVIAAAVADRQGRATRAVAPPDATASAPPAPVVRGALPADRAVHARVGDVVAVSVRTDGPDEASAPDLGVHAPTSSEVPGVLRFVAGMPGRFPVQQASDGAKLGTIVVAPAAP
jgi:hypothetical protein